MSADTVEDGRGYGSMMTMTIGRAVVDTRRVASGHWWRIASGTGLRTGAVIAK
jgi:hypothetical protein